jgi:malate dehydrogenase (oxaloacetate-decarboxylating)
MAQAISSADAEPASGAPPRAVATARSGYELLNDPLLNKGTAFTDAEREEFELHGLLPAHVTSLDWQATRRLDAFRGLGSLTTTSPPRCA